MKRWRALVLAGALALTGCDEPAGPAATPALWQVTSPDGDKGWLLGTIHALPDGVEWRTPELDRSLAEAGLLLVEIADLEDAAQSASLFEQMGHSEGLPVLSARFAVDKRESVERLLQRAGVSESDFSGMETWAAALTLSGTVSTPGDPANGVDRQLIASGKPVRGLESYAAQFVIFDRMPESEQQDLLLAVACETIAASANPAAGMEAWLAGELAALETLGNRCMMSDPELRAALLDGRNALWIDRIAASIDQGDQPFVAVGAAHMLGDHGLPALLAARGFTVERIQ